MEVYAKSDVGKVRGMNQDYFYIPRNYDEPFICILADGMGGYKGGEVASKLATNSALSYLQSNFDKISHEKENILELIKNSIEYANMIVYEKSKEEKQLDGMGTTIEICLIFNNRVYIGHVGDSRVYRLRKEFMRKLTTDHSYVQKLVKDGTITKEEAEHHPKKNMLMKALGCTAYVDPDIMVKGFQKNDMLLISSDGLTNMVTESEIYEVINKSYRNAPRILIDKANEYGGYDNVTVIIIKN